MGQAKTWGIGVNRLGGQVADRRQYTILHTILHTIFGQSRPG
jgi:hypothetical protein